MNVKLNIFLMIILFSLVSFQNIELPINLNPQYKLVHSPDAHIYKSDIVTKHRYHNGKYQHRRYNRTLRKWVDSKWIDD